MIFNILLVHLGELKISSMSKFWNILRYSGSRIDSSAPVDDSATVEGPASPDGPASEDGSAPEVRLGLDIFLSHLFILILKVFFWSLVFWPHFDLQHFPNPDPFPQRKALRSSPFYSLLFLLLYRWKTKKCWKMRMCISLHESSHACTHRSLGSSGDYEIISAFGGNYFTEFHFSNYS